MEDAARAVLIVNCTPDEREMYAEYLRFAGIQSVETCEADDAVTLAADLQPEVVVTALGLSGHDDGIDLIRRLRAHEATKHITIIVVTGRVMGDDRQRAMDAGCDVFLPKPLLPDALAHEVQRARSFKRRREYRAC